jgi:hypothetical protein
LIVLGGLGYGINAALFNGKWYYTPWLVYEN